MREIDINWSDEIRRFIERRVREYRRRKALERIDRMLKDILETEKGTAKKYIREDRDSY